MEEQEKLEKIGLSRNESAVFLSLLKLGTATADEITKKTGIYRRGVYEALEKLEEKSLITSVIKDYKKHFTASRPEHLLDSLKEKEEIIKSLIPELSKVEAEKEIEPKIEIITGIGGFKAIVKEQLASKELYGIGITLKSLEILQYSLPSIIKKDKKIKTKAKLLIYEEVKEPLKKILKGNAKLKTLPKNFYIPSTTMIWDNKISISLLQEKPFIMIIESKKINEAYKKYFEFMWNLA